MSNSLGTLSGSIVSQRALQLLFQRYPFLLNISADYSSEQSLLNQEVVVGLPSALTAQDYSADTGYLANSATQADRSVKIDQHIFTRISFSDTEFSSSKVNLLERFSEAAAAAIGERLMQDLVALVVNSNYSNKTETAAATFGWAELLAVNKKLSDRAVPGFGRYMVLNSTAYASLLSEPYICANPTLQSDVISTGRLTTVAGMQIFEWPQLPTNGERLFGFAGTAEALLLATRVPLIDRKVAETGGQVEIVVEPASGCAVQERLWYDHSAGKTNKVVTLMHGVAKGNASCIERLVTPAS